MTTEFLAATMALRDSAWAKVMASPAFAYFKAMDEATVAAGGTSILSTGFPRPPVAERVAGSHMVPTTKRLSQGDAAGLVLRELGEPLPIGRLLEKVMDKGVEFRGDDPLPSFRSAMSKDARYEPITRNNMYFWWFKGEALPSGWNETGADLLGTTPASSTYNQKGGDGHGLPTT